MARAPSIGDVVAGRYRLEGILGQGGFGAVYRAIQLNIDRPVALKLVLPEALELADGRARFLREAQLAQRLSHPNTVRLYDFGEADGVPFIALELLVGRPLDVVLVAERGIAPARVGRIARQVLKSLMEAHGLGIVHRDIKPANVFLCDVQGETDFVKVLDFGIAKKTESRTMAQLTQEGQSMGTPAYMAPEQVFGEGVSPRTDLYSVGLLMAEALTGQRVFDGDSGVMVCMEQISDRPVPLSRGVLESPLGEVIARATQKKPALRYASAAEMLEHLDRADGSREWMSRPPPPVGSAPPGAPVASPPVASPPPPGASAPPPPAPVTSPGPSWPGSVGSPRPSWPAAPSAAFAMTAASPAPTRWQPAAGAPRSSRTGLLLALVGVGLVVLLGVGVGALALTGTIALPGGRSARRGADVDEPVRPRGKARGAPVKGGLVPGKSLAQLTGETVRKRIVAAGYEVNEVTRVSTVNTYAVEARDDADVTGVVQFFRFPASDPLSAALIAEDYARDTSGVGARDGQVILWVQIDDERIRAKEVLDEITR